LAQAASHLAPEGLASIAQAAMGAVLGGISLDTRESGFRLLVGTTAATLGFVACHLLLRPVVRSTQIKAKLRDDWINRIIASAHALAVSIMAGAALAAEPPCAGMARAVARLEPTVDLVHGDPSILRWCLPLSLGYFLYDCCIMAIDSEVHSPLMVMHHVMSVIVWPISFLSQRGMWYVLYFMSTELSTPMLHLTLFFLPKHGLAESTIFLPVGVGMLAVFFLVRVLPIPFVLYSMKATWNFWEPTDWPIFMIWAATIPIPPLLNSYWFFRLLQGATKKLGPPQDGDAKKEQ